MVVQGASLFLHGLRLRGIAVSLTLSDIIKNIHYQSLRRLRLKNFGGQSLKLPRGPNYSIHKKHVSSSFFDAFFMVIQGA